RRPPEGVSSSNNLAQGGTGGDGGRSVSIHEKGILGGSSGAATGGGLMGFGSLSLATVTSTSNTAGNGSGGGVYLVAGGSSHLPGFNVLFNWAFTAENDVHGVF